MNRNIEAAYIERIILDFNKKYNTSAVIDVFSIRSALTPESGLRSSTETVCEQVKTAWSTIMFEAVAIYAATAYSHGNEPDYSEFINDFDTLVKNVILVTHSADKRQGTLLHRITYGGHENIPLILERIKRTDFQERNPSISIEKYSRMLSKAQNDIKKIIGIHRKTAESVTNNFRFQRTTKLKKLEQLIILDEYVKANFSNTTPTSLRITERDDYKTCIECIAILKKSLGFDMKKSVKEVALFALTPRQIDFYDIEKRMTKRVADESTSDIDMSDYRRRINKFETNVLASSKKNTSVRSDVARIISKIEETERKK